MNTKQLERFATSTRRKLLEQVGSKLRYVLTHDAVELRAKQAVLSALRRKVEGVGEDALVDQVAYTWFNRLVALRFMDVNGYQPIGKSVVTPHEGGVVPALLQDAQGGEIASDLQVDRDRIFKLLTGQEPSNNPDNEAYRLLLVAACNHLHATLPLLFEGIDDYAELLLPDDLSSPLSVVHDVVEGMAAEDCAEVEVIGWLYQFYISEKKDEVFATKGKVQADDIPAATQIFTPRWIVEYMVQNTVGKVWVQNNPGSALREHMPYFIESPGEVEDFLRVDSPEDITLLDQACGSGHILVYGFELLTHIYEEAGYAPSEIPGLILEHNLRGLEIDGRAAQLAGLALMLKARSTQRSFFRKPTAPHIVQLTDLRLRDEEIQDAFNRMGLKLDAALLSDLRCMQQATNLGSLIRPKTSQQNLQRTLETVNSKAQSSDAFLSLYRQQLLPALEQLSALADEVTCVVDNPPYMGGGKMNKSLSEFVKDNYPLSKADLMACFMEAGLAAVVPKGLVGMINQHTWMFLSSYEDFRGHLLQASSMETMLHLGPRTFPELSGEVVQNAAFTMRNAIPESQEKAAYVRLVDFDRSDLKAEKTLEAIANPHCDWFYRSDQSNFKKIPGSPLGYWLSDAWIKLFDAPVLIRDVFLSEGQMKTGDNDQFLRMIWEVEEVNPENGWRLCAKGGPCRRWYGNVEHVVSWTQTTRDHFRKDNVARIPKSEFWDRSGILWTGVTSGRSSFRIYQSEEVFETAAPAYLTPEHMGNEEVLNALGLFNSKIADPVFRFLNPTVNLKYKEVGLLPFVDIDAPNGSQVSVSANDWDAHETSWDFERNELIRIGGAELEDAYQGYVEHWTRQFLELHRLEEENNRYFIDLYELREELTPDVPLEEITILQQDEVDRKALAGLNGSLERDGESGLVSTYEGVQLPFNADAVMEQFVSYAVGCMFGRYSLDKPGLVLSNAGDSLEDYLEKVGMEEVALQFVPDDDNVIPVLDEAWFEDDIVGRFKTFLQVTFGEEHFHRNLAFVEASLGKDIRKYFVKDFVKDHVSRYKKRPIYWLFASPKGHFQALVYVHRYTPDTLNRMLNSYVREYIGKLEQQREQLKHQLVGASAQDEARLRKELDKLAVALKDVQDYETEILYPLAVKRIELNLDDGVYVNINRFGDAIPRVTSLNDAKARNKVKAFDWCDTTNIEA